MAIDSALAVRRAMLITMSADADLTALVPAARIFPQTTPALPAYPFIRMGAPSSIPLGATCLDGEEITIAVHAFASDRQNDGGATIETAEDFASRIGAAIAAALDKQSPTIEHGKAVIRWRGKQLLQDPEESRIYHSVQNFRVRAITS